jgi:hypothetical protein
METESPSEEEKRKILNFHIAARENDASTSIIGSWNDCSNFDELAFKNYDLETRSIMITKSTRF